MDCASQRRCPEDPWRGADAASPGCCCAVADEHRAGAPANHPGIKERFWLKDPGELRGVLERHVRMNPSRGELREIGRSFSGRPILAIRYGTGPQKIVFANAHHGWEVVTTNSAVALSWSLFCGQGLDGEDLRGFVDEVAAKQTVWILPLISPDVAARQYERFPEGFFPNAIGSATQQDWEQYVHVMNDPYETYTGERIAGRYHGFTREQVDEWLKENRYLGQRWSDQGIDIWIDYERFDTPEARAVRDFILPIEPDCVMEYHGHEGPTFVAAPTPRGAESPAKAAKQKRFGEAMVAALVATGIKCAARPTCLYLTRDGPDFVNWVETQWPDVMMLFSELQMYYNKTKERYEPDDPVWGPAAGRPMPTQEEIIRSGWTLSTALLRLGNGEAYRVC